MKPFKCATFNVNSIRSRLHIVIPWLIENRPDVLCMQETKVDNEHFPTEHFSEIGYSIVFSGSKTGRNGVAIASLKKPENISIGFPTEPKEKDRLLVATFSEMTIINTYVPQGYSLDDERFRYKLNWFARLKKFIEQRIDDDINVLWCGDMNVAPTDLDVTNPNKKKNHVCFHTDVKKAFHDVVSLGFIDIFRKHHPHEPDNFTFFDYRVKNAVSRNIGWRVDHIMATNTVADHTKKCYIDIKPRLLPKPSDHTVLIAEMEI
jgi:exodeoxyribonuclease-3